MIKNLWQDIKDTAGFCYCKLMFWQMLFASVLQDFSNSPYCQVLIGPRPSLKLWIRASKNKVALMRKFSSDEKIRIEDTNDFSDELNTLERSVVEHERMLAKFYS